MGLDTALPRHSVMGRAAALALPIVLATTAVILSVVALLHYREDLSKRAAAERYVKKFHLDVRRPDHVRTIHYAPAADLAAEIAADAALQDATGVIDLEELDAETRQLWIEDVARFGEELDAARALLIAGLRDRPGYAYHRLLLGQVEHARSRQRGELGLRSGKWLGPLTSAMQFAPGDRSMATFTAAALIEAWDSLDDAARRRSRPVLVEAFRDPQFVTASYLDVIAILGHEATFALLPSDPRSLRAAIGSEAAEGDVAAAAKLYPRWERAEWSARVTDLAALRRRDELSDEGGLRTAAHRWAAVHSIYDFDNAAGLRQTLTLLELWPADAGTWDADPRRDFVTFLLDRRSLSGRVAGSAVVSGAEVDKALAGVIPRLGGVPRPLAARAALLRGDLFEGEAAARNADTAGAFEWTPFYVELAYQHLKRNDSEDAAQALALVPEAAQDECNVAVARMSVARSTGGVGDVNEALFPRLYAEESWSGLRLPVCIDPFRRDREIAVGLEVAGSPALVGYGFDDGRMATRLLPVGSSQLTMPLEGRSGRHIVTLAVVAGSTVTPRTASLR